MSQAPLKLLHPDTTLEGASLTYWRNQSTSTILASLTPGSDESLKVKDDGTVMNGNTRIKVLMERHYGVDHLPRERYAGGPSYNWEDGY